MNDIVVMAELNRFDCLVHEISNIFSLIEIQTQVLLKTYADPVGAFFKQIEKVSIN